MKAPILEIASAAALERRLSRTLRDLAAIGDKRAGSAAGAASATGTGTPVPGGMTSREAFHLLRSLKGVKLAGMDLVEVCPALDHADITSHLGAHLLFEGLALLA